MKEDKLPLVTVIFLSYCQENYVKESLDSVLNFDYENIEIIISDDASTDSTLDIINGVLGGYTGNKSIIYTPNKENLGLVANFNKCLSLAKGDFFAVAAGDDISLPERISKAIKCFNDHEGLSMVSFSDFTIDAQGTRGKVRNAPVDRFYDLYSFVGSRKFSISGASRVFRRDLYDAFGPLSDDCPTDDTTFIVRALILGRILVTGCPGIYYRVHSGSLSSYSSLYRMDFENIFKQYLIDISLALKTGILDVGSSMALVEWVNCSRKTRVLDKIIYNKNRSWSGIFELFSHKGVSFYYKIRIFLKHYMRARV